MNTTYKLYANTNPLNKNMMVCVLSSDNLMTTNNEEKLRLVKTKNEELQLRGFKTEIWKETKQRVKVC